jgi:hypothetical protein
MTVTVKTLIHAKTAESSQTTQYTATNVTTIIDKFTAQLDADIFNRAAVYFNN